MGKLTFAEAASIVAEYRPGHHSYATFEDREMTEAEVIELCRWSP